MTAPLDFRALTKFLPVLIGAGLLGAISAFASSYLVQPVYRASTLMAPSEVDPSLLGAAGGALGGLQSVAGLVGLGGQSDSVDKGLAILRSRSFCEGFLASDARRDLLESEWRARNRISAALAGQSTPVSTETLCAFFVRSVLALATDPRTRFVTLSVRMTDRLHAAGWTNALSTSVNEQMRKTEIENATVTLEYLERELSGAPTVELREAIARAMEAQVRNKAFAATRPSYAFSVIDPAIAPDEGRFESPRRIMLALGGGILAGFVALVVLVVRRRS